jgi:hypothetical protein
VAATAFGTEAHSKGSSTVAAQACGGRPHRQIYGFPSACPELVLAKLSWFSFLNPNRFGFNSSVARARCNIDRTGARYGLTFRTQAGAEALLAGEGYGIDGSVFLPTFQSANAEKGSPNQPVCAAKTTICCVCVCVCVFVLSLSWQQSVARGVCGRPHRTPAQTAPASVGTSP